MQVFLTYTVKNCLPFSRPWPVIIKLFPARESLVSDIPAGDGKIANLFLQCMQIIAIPINHAGGRVCVPNGKRSFAANQATKYMFQISINKMKLGALFFLYRKEYLPGENNREISARFVFNVFKSTIFPIRESQTTILNPPYSKHLLYTEG
jgi:hypothetical protein